MLQKDPSVESEMQYDDFGFRIDSEGWYIDAYQKPSGTVFLLPDESCNNCFMYDGQMGVRRENGCVVKDPPREKTLSKDFAGRPTWSSHTTTL